MDILLQGKFFQNSKDIGLTRKCLLHLLEGLTNMNRAWIRSHPETPGIYDAGIEYISDPFNANTPPELELMQKLNPGEEAKLELWSMIPNIIEQGGSDCKNLAAWRCAELREQGYHCRPWIKWKKMKGFTLYHVLVEYVNPDTRRYSHPGEQVMEGLIEDPSRILGMGVNGK